MVCHYEAKIDNYQYYNNCCYYKNLLKVYCAHVYTNKYIDTLDSCYGSLFSGTRASEDA